MSLKTKSVRFWDNMAGFTEMPNDVKQRVLIFFPHREIGGLANLLRLRVSPMVWRSMQRQRAVQASECLVDGYSRSFKFWDLCFQYNSGFGRMDEDYGFVVNNPEHLEDILLGRRRLFDKLSGLDFADCSEAATRLMLDVRGGGERCLKRKRV